MGSVRRFLESNRNIFKVRHAGDIPSLRSYVTNKGKWIVTLVCKEARGSYAAMSRGGSGGDGKVASTGEPFYGTFLHLREQLKPV